MFFKAHLNHLLSFGSPEMKRKLISAWELMSLARFELLALSFMVVAIFQCPRAMEAAKPAASLLQGASLSLSLSDRSLFLSLVSSPSINRDSLMRCVFCVFCFLQGIQRRLIRWEWCASVVMGEEA